MQLSRSSLLESPSCNARPGHRWRYDAAAGETIRPDNQRRTTILRYASWAAVFPISLVVRLHFDSALSISRGIDVMGQYPTRRNSFSLFRSLCDLAGAVDEKLRNGVECAGL